MPPGSPSITGGGGNASSESSLLQGFLDAVLSNAAGLLFGLAVAVATFFIGLARSRALSQSQVLTDHRESSARTVIIPCKNGRQDDLETDLEQLAPCPEQTV